MTTETHQHRPPRRRDSASSHRPGQGASLLTRIAAGIDGFPEGEDAAVLGAELAKATSAELMLVSVQPDPLLLPPLALNWKETEKETEAMLHRIRESLAPSARTAVLTDLSVPRALQRLVHRQHRDLLVMGSSRQGREGHVRIGKRTRQLLCHFESPLAVAPRGFHERPHRRFHRIGVGYDGGPESQAALSLAAWVAAAAGSDLEIEAVVDDRMPPLGWSRFAHGGADHPLWEDAVLAEAERRRADTEAAAQASGPRAHVEIERGRPADAMLALSQRVDLVIIGSRRWGPMARVLLGSTGEALLHDAACPVMVVPRPAG